MDGVTAAVRALESSTLTVADHAELAEASRAVARLQSFIDHAKVRIARRGRELAEAGDTSSSHVLIDEGRCTGNDAKATNGRGGVCDQMPAFEDALAEGAVTGGHLDALANHTKNLTDAERSELNSYTDELVADATKQPAGLFERHVRNLVDAIRSHHRPDADVTELDRQRAASNVKRWTDKATGMRQTLISLDPLRDASIWAVFDAQLARLRQRDENAQRPFAELQIEAIVASIGQGDAAPRVPEVVVHVDSGSLCHGRHDGTLSETVDGEPVPVATVQRLCCEAVIQAVVVSPDGTIDRLCAEQRTANRQQRRMLEGMYATCAHPECTVGFSRCRIHHIRWWSRGGRTVLDNLIPLCERHHHLVHEGGWNLRLDHRRRLTWIKPDGTSWRTDTGPNRPPPQRQAA